MKKNEVLIMEAQMKMTGANIHDVNALLSMYLGTWESPEVFINVDGFRLIMEQAIRRFINGGDPKKIREEIDALRVTV